jgi:hypothetical protein
MGNQAGEPISGSANSAGTLDWRWRLSNVPGREEAKKQVQLRVFIGYFAGIG